MSRSIANVSVGTTYLGSTSLAPTLGKITLGPRYLYVRIWRFWMKFGRNQSA